MNERKMSRWADRQRDRWSISQGWSCQNHLKYPCPSSPEKTSSFRSSGLPNACSITAPPHAPSPCPHGTSSWEDEFRSDFPPGQMETWASILPEKHISVLGPQREPLAALEERLIDHGIPPARPPSPGQQV